MDFYYSRADAYVKEGEELREGCCVMLCWGECMQTRQIRLGELILKCDLAHNVRQ